MVVLNGLFRPEAMPVGNNSQTSGLPGCHPTPDEMFCKPIPSTQLDGTGFALELCAQTFSERTMKTKAGFVSID